MMEIDTLLKRRSSISEDIRVLPECHGSTTMTPTEPVLGDFMTDHLSDNHQIQLQPESNTESWLNLQLASSLQGPSGHNPSIFLSQTTSLQYQPLSFHQDPNLPLDAGQPPGEANGTMGPDSHMLESDAHNPTGFDFPTFGTSTDFRGTAP